MADCILMKSGGTSEGRKCLYDLPLTEDLTDKSEYNRQTIYNGDTPLTISANGLYLYDGRLELEDFWDDIVNDRYSVEFDFTMASSGASKYPYYRRLLYSDNFGVEHYNHNYLLPGAFKNYSAANMQSRVSYNDGNYYHIIVDIILASRTVVCALPNDSAWLRLANNELFETNKKIYFGHINYGWNGYIKNVKIYTG